MSKEKTLDEKIIFIDRLIASTFSNKAYLYYLNIIDEYEEQKEEIERLSKELDKTRLSELDKEYKLNQVREYITNHREAVDERGEHIIYFLTDDFDEKDILEILDKVSDKK